MQAQSHFTRFVNSHSKCKLSAHMRTTLLQLECLPLRTTNSGLLKIQASNKTNFYVFLRQQNHQSEV